MLIILLILLSAVLALSNGTQTRTDDFPRWQYQGTYKAGDVLADLCDRTGCSLGLSGDVVELPITLSVKTSSQSVLLQSLRNALLFSGYYLTGSLSSNLSVYRDGTYETTAFVNYLGQVQIVPKTYLEVYKQADKKQALLDSLSKIPPQIVRTPSKRWLFRFYSVSSAALKSYGLEVSHPLVSGEIVTTVNPLKHASLSSTYTIDYLSTLDSLFEYRSFEFDLDSTLDFSWGTQKQVIDKVIIDNGIQTNSYSWRQYGLDVHITSYPVFKMSYTLRSPDESTINGQSSLADDSTVTIVSQYSMYQDGESCFLPFSIFCKPTRTREERFLYFSYL